MAATVPDDDDHPSVTAVAEALRIKDKEMRRREELYRENLAELNKSKAVVESVLQELDAREVVLTAAEAKHGSLLKREADCDAREKELVDRERRLSERRDTLNEREAALQNERQALRTEHEQRMFPLAALEQELVRREADLRSLEADHEAKLRSFQARVHHEEERERLREKQLRDQEARLKEGLARVERREKELEAAENALGERSRALKTEQVELESRDRDQKWREEQLRVSQLEMHAIKARLMTWERQLDVKHAQHEAALVELQLKQQEVVAKELTLTDRMSRLLQAEAELNDRSRQLDADLANATELNRNAEQKHSSLSSAQQSLEEKRAQIERERASVAEDATAAAKEHESAARKLAKLREKEAALKNWVTEIEWREQQVLKREQQMQGSSAMDQSSPSTTTAKDISAGLVRSQLAHATETYLGGFTLGQRTSPTHHSAPPLVDETVARAAELTDAADLDQKATTAAALFAQCALTFYSMSDEAVRHVFRAAESAEMRRCFEAEEGWREEVDFLLGVFRIDPRTGQSSLPLSLTTTAQWQLWFSTAFAAAVKRKSRIQALRLSKLSAAAEMFAAREGSEKNAEYFPAKRFRLQRAQREHVEQHDETAEDTDDRRRGSERSTVAQSHGVRGKHRGRTVAEMHDEVRQLMSSLPQET